MVCSPGVNRLVEKPALPTGAPATIVRAPSLMSTVPVGVPDPGGFTETAAWNVTV